MSIETIGARLAEIGQMAQALSGPRPAPHSGGASFATALQSAQVPNMAQTLAAQPTSATGQLNGSDPSRFDGMIEQAARKHGLDPALLKGLIKQESGFNPSARSPVGAQGLTQLMPATAAGLGVSDPTDPEQAIDGGARYLKQQLERFDGDVKKALAAYNAGPGAVAKYGGVPPYAETQNYVRAVLANAERYGGGAAAAAAPPPPVPSAPAPSQTPPVLATTKPGSLPYSTV